MTIPVVEDRCLSDRTPGLANGGNQDDARFVDKDEVGCQPCSVFLNQFLELKSRKELLQFMFSTAGHIES